MNEKRTKARPPAEAEHITVTLLAPHTHRGVERAPGEQVKLLPGQAERLIQAGRAEVAHE